MAEQIGLAALALEAALGWPPFVHSRIGHPVGAFARAIDACERRWNRPDRSDVARRLYGALTMALLFAMAGGSGWLLQALLVRLVGAWSWIGVAILAWPSLAQRSLYDHVRAVSEKLRAGDIAGARSKVAMIVGRDTETLDEAGIARAAVESLSESFCDGVVAPLFWLLVGFLPGAWIYKAANTADSLIGHREERWRAFGWAAARTDDMMNLIPARLSGILICFAARGGWRTMWRDASSHTSPNAGWPEAAMAGALRLRLAGPAVYDGAMHEKAWIGDGREDATGADIDLALGVYIRACLLLWFLAGGVSWAL